MNEARKGFVGIPIYEAANINGDIFRLWEGYVMFLGNKVYATDCKILVRASVLEVCNFEPEELKLLDGMAISAKMMKTLSRKNITKVSVEEVKLKREDASFNDAVETDILVARLALRATEVIINPVTYTGGKQVFSAEEIATGCRCFFDTEETFTAAVLHWTESNGVECKYTLRPIASMGKLPNFDAIFCEEREATDEIAFKPELIDRLGRAMGIKMYPYSKLIKYNGIRDIMPLTKVKAGYMFVTDPSSVKAGDIVYSAVTGREVEVLEINPPKSLLIKPTDGKVFYQRCDGEEVMQAWFSYERILRRKED